MALSKQIRLYAIDTACFYNDNERKIHNHMRKRYLYRSKVTLLHSKCKNEEEKFILRKRITRNNKSIKKLKTQLLEILNQNTDLRELNPDTLLDKNIVAMFDSSLTRAMNLQKDELTTDLFIVQTYFFKVIEDIIKSGFMFNGEKYICFTASAGQIRTKKTVFIKESVATKLMPTLMCGLTMDGINKCGGININKYLAYLALSSSATDLWKSFNIDRSIVVDDLELNVNGDVDFISDETFEIERKNMDIEINVTDGCGMVLPKKSKKNFMVRLPWVKGLLMSFPFDEFVKQHGKTKIKDIYGKEYDIVEDNIQVIFTKSQFKMYQYYKSWDEYKSMFKEFNCQAATCNEEEDYVDNAKINYQMLQTLIDINDSELNEIAKKTNYNITNIGKKRGTMLRVLGVTKANRNKNNLQQALELYPELLGDEHCKEILRQTKKKLVYEGRAGKLDINGKYTFISPDLYGFCEYLFLGDKNPKGLLSDKEVFCNLYPSEPKLNCLRSPHLYMEHAVRNNVVDEEKQKWFTTNALYISSHDLISKIIMCDWDGDKSLVVADKTIIDVAERNSKDIVPLCYDMKKAGKMDLNYDNIYNGLKVAYTGGNIGIISNDITKIWNSDNFNLDVVKLLCMLNNHVIDYAKTLYKPEVPKHISDLITSYTKNKTPYFFMYAKGKKKHQVEPKNNSPVNRLHSIVKNKTISMSSAGLGEFDYKMLMKNKKFELDLSKESLDSRIINLYKKLDRSKKIVAYQEFEERNSINQTQDNLMIYEDIRNEFILLSGNLNYTTDVLVKYLFGFKQSRYKTTLWSCFGDIIVNNIRNNITFDNITYCQVCGDVIEKLSNRSSYCDVCWKEKERKNKADRNKRYYQKIKKNKN